MPVLDLYSKRVEAAENPVNDVYEYDELPEKLKNQIIMLWRNVSTQNFEFYELIVQLLREEYGRFYLIGDQYSYLNQSKKLKYCHEWEDAFQQAPTKEALDYIELSFRLLLTAGAEYFSLDRNKIKESNETLNIRFKENRVGYRFEDGYIIRVDSTLLHKEVVKPSISLLSQQKYKGPNEEYMKAWSFYQKGDYKDAITNAGSAFESMMKVILDEHEWEYGRNDGASALVGKLFVEERAPIYMKAKFNALKELLRNSVPTVRNHKSSSHGQGSSIKKASEADVSYVLHMTGSAMLYLSKVFS